MLYVELKKLELIAGHIEMEILVLIGGLCEIILFIVMEKLEITGGHIEIILIDMEKLELLGPY